nr:hypothetical protein [Micromonospora sp. DSM 115978]
MAVAFAGVAVGVVAPAYVPGATTDPAGLRGIDERGRIVLWGDSLAWEAQDAFGQVAHTAGADVRVRAFGGTAICDWFDDIDVQLDDWAPTTSVLAFSGNAMSSCMQGRDVATAYRHDATTAATRLAAAGV